MRVHRLKPVSVTEGKCSFTKVLQRMWKTQFTETFLLRIWMLQTAHFKIKHTQNPSLNMISFHCASPWLIWRTMCDLSQRTLNCSRRDCLYCEKVCYKRGEILLRELAAWKLSLSPACPKDSLSGLYCLECDCSPSFLPSLLLSSGVIMAAGPALMEVRWE